MILGIVGAEAAKFTPRGELRARLAIRALIRKYKPTALCSGECHLGGADSFAREEAARAHLPFLPCPPKARNWSDGYRSRNVKIAKQSDYVVCLTVNRFPRNFTGPRYTYCYHCKSSTHIKSGGCWTVKFARSLGKPGRVITLTQ